MTTLSAPSASSCFAAAATPASSSGTSTSPSASIRSSTSRRRRARSAARSGPSGRRRRPGAPAELEDVAKAARRDQADAWRSCARASRWSSSSCRARSRRARAGSTPAASSAAITPKAWLSTVVGTLAMRTSPLVSSTTDQVGEGAADVAADEFVGRHARAACIAMVQGAVRGRTGCARDKPGGSQQGLELRLERRGLLPQARHQGVAARGVEPRRDAVISSAATGLPSRGAPC